MHEAFNLIGAMPAAAEMPLKAAAVDMGKYSGTTKHRINLIIDDQSLLKKDVEEYM